MSLAELRTTLGPAPRCDTDVLPPPPGWAAQDKIHTIWDNAQRTWRTGTPVLGRIVMANGGLWDGTAGVAPASVVYSFDHAYAGNPQRLMSICEALFAFHEHGPEIEVPRDPWMRRTRDLLFSGFERPLHERVPTAITGGPVVYQTTVVISAPHLPKNQLNHHALPIVVDRVHGLSLMVPGRLWPTALSG